MFLSEVIRNFDAQLSQEQTWAVCHVTTKYLVTKRRENMIKRRSIRFEVEAETVQLTMAGGVEVMCKEETGRRQTESEIIQNIGKLLMQCLGKKAEDFSHLRDKHSEPDLDELISGLVNRKFDEHDEGYEGDFAYDLSLPHKRRQLRQFRNLDDVCVFCDDRLHRKNIASGSQHYVNVMKALYYEAYELKSFLDHVTVSLSLASEAGDGNNMAPSVANTAEECVHEWARFWLQVMHELRRGVHLRKVSQTKISPEEYELLPQELVFNNDISTAVTLHSSPRGSLPENARDILIDFISSKHTGKRKLRLLPYLEEIDDNEDYTEAEMGDIDDGEYGNEANNDEDSENAENDVCGEVKRKQLTVGSPLWERVNNWDASFESLLSSDRNSKDATELSPRSLLNESDDQGMRRNSYELGSSSPRVVADEAQRRWSDVNTANTDLTNCDLEVPSDNDANANATDTTHAPKKRLAVNPQCFTEVSLEEDQRVFGTSLFEIAKTRQAIVKAEEELLSHKDSKTKAILNGLVCFSCRKSKFSLFSKLHQCHICSKRFCKKCILENVEVPNHLVDTKQHSEQPKGSNLATSKGISKSVTDLVTGVGDNSITPFPCKRHTLLQISSRRTYGGKVTSMCEECKVFIESIITETKNLRWHVGMTLDI